MQSPTKINYNKLNTLPPLVTKYLAKDDKLVNNVTGFWSLEAFKKQIELKRTHSINRSLLVNELLKQYKDHNITNAEKTLSNINLLNESNTFTITTGHQLNLFTGPLYFVYKIITAINLAETLKTKFPSENFVPVYWMASEDHDFEEVNHINIFGKRLEWKKEAKGRVGKLDTKGLTEAIEELNGFINKLPFGNEFIEIVKNAYLTSDNYASATFKLVHTLFGKYGLVVIDADNSAFKRSFTEIIIDDALNNNSFKIVNATLDKLVAEGMTAKAQVNPREINLFYVAENIRERIQKEGENLFTESGQKWTVEEFKTFADLHPEKISPNVILRPVYQELILPNLAYIGGAGELSYWLQLKGVFDHYKIPFPLLGLRHSLMLIDEQTHERINKFNFSLEDLYLNEDALVNKYISSKKENDGEQFSEEKIELEKLYSDIKNNISKVDVTLANSVDAELQKTLNGLQALEGKIKKAIKQKSEVEVNQIKKIKQKLFPENTLQERYENLSFYYANNGAAFIEHVKENLKDFEPGFYTLKV